MKKSFIFKIGGEAGFGIMSSGLNVSKLAARSGYFAFDYSEYPSIVRGGHNLMQIVIAEEPARAQYKSTNFLVALNKETIDLHIDELENGASLLCDEENKPLIKSKKINIFLIPVNKIAKEVGGSLLLRNTAALGASIALLGGDLKIFKDLIAQEFSAKDPKITKNNFAVCQAAYDYAKQNYGDKIQNVLKPRKTETKIVVNGNEAMALGAVAAGMKFSAIYPMTPISGILHTLSSLQEKYDFVCKQPEDEIAAINMAIGASFAGARSMVATSGGGFCLMAEGCGLAGISEIPIVIINGMRGAPATGMPTWTAQGDLRMVLHAHQGDFPRIVLAAGDIEEAFHLTMQAFNLADKYQTPVVVLVDKQICESHMSLGLFNYVDYKVDVGKLLLKKQDNYKRFALSPDGISMRSPAGFGNYVMGNSDEHDEAGYSNESIQNRINQMNKRMQKLQTCAKTDMPAPKLFGPKNADLTVISWGSNKGAILEAMKNLKNVNFLHLTWANPFPTKAVKKVLKKARKILNVECNYSAQMAGLIQEKTGIAIKNNLLKYDGRPFYPEEIIAQIKKII